MCLSSFDKLQWTNVEGAWMKGVDGKAHRDTNSQQRFRLINWKNGQFCFHLCMQRIQDRVAELSSIHCIAPPPLILFVGRRWKRKDARPSMGSVDGWVSGCYLSGFVMNECMNEPGEMKSSPGQPVLGHHRQNSPGWGAKRNVNMKSSSLRRSLNEWASEAMNDVKN